jgi:hypothetical protein
MKTFVHHDSAGTIRSLITVNAPKGMSVMMTPKPGEFATETEDLGLKGTADVEAVRKAVRNHRIAISPSRSTPVKKGDA